MNLNMNFLDIRTVKSWIFKHAETGSVQSNYRNCGNPVVDT